ncbi:NEL-type E3 ubiquitin ligase domain-containing protein [Pseudomonas sp. ESBL9]|uniref:NEL-type E3 ubiquitin ligase domain-containing protein n=1 Tax=Pseudomonas sp. ESBL9 TaxID=3077327 RepID=UPI002FCAFCF5
MTLSSDGPQRPPALLTAKLIAQQEALAFMAANMRARFADFDNDLIKRYIDLQRAAQSSMKEAETETTRFREAFKATHLTRLKQELEALTGEDVDPEQTRIYTRYLEFKEGRTPLDLLSEWFNPRANGEEKPVRLRRALDESKTVEHVRSMTLWEAACANFGFSTDSIFLKPFSFVEASFIHYGPASKAMDVRGFIAIVRRLDMGGALAQDLVQATAPDGILNKLIGKATRASFEFDLLEAYRNAAVSGIKRQDYQRLLKVFNDPHACNVRPVSVYRSARAIFDDPMETSLVVLEFEDVKGVYSYFPNRPGGALLYHPPRTSFTEHFRRQLKRSHREQNLGWFAAQLSLPALSQFQQLLSDEPRPPGLSWLAGKLYDGFHLAFPEPTLDSLKFRVEPVGYPRRKLVDVLSRRQIKRYKTNLSLMASSRSAADWQALKDAMLAIGNELLSLLMTPVPGGVTGLTRVMQIVVFGSLGYSFAKGVIGASRGEPDEFASALADTADLLLTGWLIGVGGRVHDKRMNALWSRLREPRKVTLGDASSALWRPDLNQYSLVEASTLDSLTPDIQGLYDINNKLYVKVYDGDAVRAGEVVYDPKDKRYVLNSPDPHAYRPPVKFDPAKQMWHVVLDDVSNLSDGQLLQRMLPFDSKRVAIKDIELMLRTTATPRAQLEQVWQGGPLPGPLADGVRRLRVEQHITRIIDDLPLRGEMPANADQAVFALLTQLPHWPADTVLNVFDRQGVRIESYGPDPRPGVEPHSIDIKRLDTGRYVAREDVTQGPASVEQLFTLIVDQLPEGSVLGRDDNQTASKTSRIATLREQIAQLAQTERALLFQALTVLEGHQRSDPVASRNPARKFLPRVYPPFSSRTSALIAKLHALNSSLSVACLEQLLAQHPFSGNQARDALQHNRQPIPFSEAADRLKIQLRIDQALDGIYYTRAYNPDIDQWTREFAKGLLSDKLDRYLAITEHDAPYLVRTGPDDNAVELRHYGNGIYKAYDVKNSSVIPVPETSDSFYLAIVSVLQPRERTLLGMQHPTDSQGFRTALGDAMSAMRQPSGEVRLWDNSASQYRQNLRLPRDLKPDELGLYHLNGKQYVPLYGWVFQVEYDKVTAHWRLKHPSSVGVDAPVLEHNYEGAWRVSTENPLQWQGLTLLRRLRATSFSFEDSVGKQIMQVSHTDEGTLRHVHVNNRAAPPLLMDTWKRFDIEAEIHRFVNAMQEHYSLRTARADIQLLLLQSLPGWPRDKVLQVVDEQGNTLAEYGADLSSATPRVKLSREDASNGSLLRAVLMRLDKADTLQLLGDYEPVIELRMLALGKKLGEHALARMPDVFKSLYEKEEKSANPHVQLIQKDPTQLPLSVIRTLLQRATAHEKSEYLDKGDIAPRLAEQMRLTAREVRLTRAYEGLYLKATATPDSEKLMLHLLQALPGWPAQVAIEVRSQTPDGPVLDSIGTAEPGHYRRLVKQEHQYLAYSSDGSALNTLPEAGNNLLSSILHVLSEDERAAIGLQGVEDSQTLGAKISDLALAHRTNIRTLLGLETEKPWIEPVIRMDTSIIAYPLYPPTGAGAHPNDLIRKAVLLYPSLTGEQINHWLNRLGNDEASRYRAVEQRRVEFESHKQQLEAWAARDVVSAGSDQAAPNPARHEAVQRMLSAWRTETEALYSPDGQFIGYTLDLSNLAVGDLPALTSNFSHIGSLVMEGMGLYNDPSHFLSRFTGLRHLAITNNRLAAVPQHVSQMTGLTRLDLSGNRIVLTPESAQGLSALTSLRVLNLNFNLIGSDRWRQGASAVPDVTHMTELRELHLRGNQLLQWPSGLVGLTHLETVRMDFNHLFNIPQAILELPADSTVARSIRLSGNPLLPEVMEQLEVYHQRTGWSFGIILPDRTVPEHDHKRLVAMWFPPGLARGEKARRTRQWDLLRREGRVAEDFFRVLRDMTGSREYETSSTRQPLQERVWELIDLMLESTVLRQTVFHEINFVATCADGVMVIFGNLEVTAQVHKIERMSTEQTIAADLLTFAKSLFRLRQVDDIANRDIRERYQAGTHPDDAEIQLYYRVYLAEELGLPLKTRSMQHEQIAGVTPQKLNDAKAHVLSLDRSPALHYSITREKFWRRFLKRKYEARFKAVREDYDKKREQLASHSETLEEALYIQQGEEAAASHKQAREALFDELTRFEQAAAGLAG